MAALILCLKAEGEQQMNKVMLMGRLTRDPEVRYSQGVNQTAIARFSLAVDRRIKREGQPTADFFNCTAFGKQAEFIERYLHKGTKILISGRVENEEYTNKDGQQVRSTKIMIEEIEFAESRSDGNNAGNNAGNDQPAASGAGGSDGFMNIPDGIDEELPFN